MTGCLRLGGGPRTLREEDTRRKATHGLPANTLACEAHAQTRSCQHVGRSMRGNAKREHGYMRQEQPCLRRPRPQAAKHEAQALLQTRLLPTRPPNPKKSRISEKKSASKLLGSFV